MFKFELKKNKFHIYLLINIFLVFLFAGHSPVSAQSVEENLSIANRNLNTYFVALNYPGMGVGWRNGRHSLEMKVFYGGTNMGYGPRYDYHWSTFEGGSLYLGFEYLNVDFEGDISEGQGKIYGMAPGVELFHSENYSFGFDMGPYQVDLKDNNTSIRESGWEMIMNMNYKIYF